MLMNVVMLICYLFTIVRPKLFFKDKFLDYIVENHREYVVLYIEFSNKITLIKWTMAQTVE